jgi:competence/damage-inducible protein CinA-like protein
MRAEIIAIGSELVSGQRLDTNSQWLSERLGELGIEVHFHTVLGDDLQENVDAFCVAAGRAALVVMTGGLGPTQDDLTREALAQVRGVPLVEHAEALAAIEQMFARRRRPMAVRNRVQAMFPEGSEPIPNRVGTAPGIWMRLGESLVACLPGVPTEMRVMFAEQLAPRLRQLGLVERVIVHHKINLFGRGESDIEADALDLTARGRTPEVGITAHDATISFRVSAAGATEAEARQSLEPTLQLIRQRFHTLVVGDGDNDVAEGLVSELARTGLTLAVAESCTGGLIAHRITTIAGVSPYFPGGVVSYSNDAKVDLLGVRRDLLAAHGAVSAEVAEAMAVGARLRFLADIGLSVTGVAGPTGGSEEKPVGLVYLGLATTEGVASRRLDLGAEQPRDVIQSRAAKHAMNWARLHLIETREGSTSPNKRT